MSRSIIQFNIHRSIRTFHCHPLSSTVSKHFHTQHFNSYSLQKLYSNRQQYNTNPINNWILHWKHLVTATTATFIATTSNSSTVFCEASNTNDILPGELRHELPFFTLDEISKHKSAQDGGIWVIYKRGVYDITEFIMNHPGGANRIKLAAGGSIEPFWKLYQQHNAAFVHEILEEMRIGNISENDAKALTEKQQSSDVNDPYSNDPIRHPALVVRSEKPFNAEPPSELLAEHMITPVEVFYKRNHLPVPFVHEDSYKLKIIVEGIDGSEKELTVDDIKKYPKHSVMATMQCAGNRRNELSRVKPVKGGSWEIGAIGNAVWSGALLSDVLKDCGVDVKSVSELKLEHAQFEGLDKDPTTPTTYGASVPIELVMDSSHEVILAYEMNGEILDKDHGYPIRAVIPGIVGARNVKWLGKVVLSQNESGSHWQQSDYKSFSPSIDWDSVDYSSAPAIQELPVQSAICDPSEGTVIDEELSEITVKGYAWSGGGRGIIRVDVTADNGKYWHTAELEIPDQKRNHVYGWTLWKVTIPLSDEMKKNGRLELKCKATDSAYNTQPETAEHIWNLRGVLNNAWHRITIPIQHSSN